jgi:hypothetical protein
MPTSSSISRFQHEQPFSHDRLLLTVPFDRNAMPRGHCIAPAKLILMWRSRFKSPMRRCKKFLQY